MTELQKLRKRQLILIKELNKINEIIYKQHRITLEDALKRVYEVRLQSKGKSRGCRISLPICFAGKKVELRIVK